MSEIALPEFERLTEAHDSAVIEHGGSLGIRDPDALHSALNRPRTMLGYQDGLDLFDLAAGFAHSLIRNHPFVDGNKRASWLAIWTFLQDNGIDIDPDPAAVVDQLFALANRQIDERELAAWLRSL